MNTKLVELRFNSNIEKSFQGKILAMRLFVTNIFKFHMVDCQCKPLGANIT